MNVRGDCPGKRSVTVPGIVYAYHKPFLSNSDLGIIALNLALHTLWRTRLVLKGDPYGNKKSRKEAVYPEAVGRW